MKIGILSTCEHYQWAGTEEVWFHFAMRALNEGHQVILGAHELVAASSQVAELKSQGMQVYSRSPCKPTRFYLLKERFNSQMAALAQCEVILVNAGSLYDSLNLPWIAQTLRSLVDQNKRVIFFCHFCAESMPATSHADKAIETFIGEVSEWVFVSEHNHKLAQRQLATTFKKSTVVMNGPRLKLDQPLPMPTGQITLGCVARLETRWKGHDVLLECLSQQQWRCRDWKLNIYGTGPDENYIRRLINLYDLADRVTMCGYVRDMQEVWSACHAKVLASHGEGTPLAVLEAMMCGRTVITTDAGGNREILSHGETGFIADAATPRSYGETLESAWQQRDLWSAMGNQAHADAQRLANADPAGELLKVVTAVS